MPPVCPRDVPVMPYRGCASTRGTVMVLWVPGMLLVSLLLPLVLGTSLSQHHLVALLSLHPLPPMSCSAPSPVLPHPQHHPLPTLSHCHLGVTTLFPCPPVCACSWSHPHPIPVPSQSQPPSHPHPFIPIPCMSPCGAALSPLRAPGHGQQSHPGHDVLGRRWGGAP